jgi:hypothetical protein
LTNDYSELLGFFSGGQWKKDVEMKTILKQQQQLEKNLSFRFRNRFVSKEKTESD